MFHRVEENAEKIGYRRRLPWAYRQAANRAVDQIRVRSLNTALIALLPVAAVLIENPTRGGHGVLQDLALVLLVGIAVSTYSSMFIAPPPAVALKEHELYEKLQAALSELLEASTILFEDDGFEELFEQLQAATINRLAAEMPAENSEFERLKVASILLWTGATLLWGASELAANGEFMGRTRATIEHSANQSTTFHRHLEQHPELLDRAIGTLIDRRQQHAHDTARYADVRRLAKLRVLLFWEQHARTSDGADGSLPTKS